ncbi:MAG: CspA family cold shock protein [Glaciecola sp.]|jgi:CspA family cold shock protein
MDALQHQTGSMPIIRPGRSTGTVRWYSAEKGYGFIAPEEGDEDVFVRFSAIESSGFRTLDAGKVVTFITATDARGPRAIEVRGA